MIPAIPKLDPLLESSWRKFDAYFLACLRARNIEAGLALLAYLEPFRGQLIAETDYGYYAVALHALAGDAERTRQALAEARRYGCRDFSKFLPASRDWTSSGMRFDPASGRLVQRSDGASIHENDPHRIYERYLFLEEGFYRQPALLAYAEALKRPVPSDVPRPDFNISTTPLCWLETTILGRAKARCEVTGASLVKGEPVHLLRYFNACYDIPTDPFYVGADGARAAHFLENKRRYDSDGYALTDFRFHVFYRSSAINGFWNDLDAFDLGRTLAMIAEPPASPTPYNFDGADDPVGEPARVNSGMGGRFLDLLWVLLKCGFARDIIGWLPEAPPHVAATLLLFDRAELRHAAAEHLRLPQLVDIYALLGKSHPSPADIAALVRFGQAHPDFQERLAQSLRRYEYHLYSNYSPGANWFYREFRHLVLGGGGRFLYLLASRPELLPAFAAIKERRMLPHGDQDAYRNSLPYLFEVLVLDFVLAGDRNLAPWHKVAAAKDGTGSKRFSRALARVEKVAALL